MIYSFGGLSSYGSKKLNQDCAYYCLAECGEEYIAFLVVCDGMGGLEHGELASTTVLSAFEMWFQREIPSLANRFDRMEQVRLQWNELLDYENRHLYEISQQQNIQMGTALAALLLWEDSYLSVNVGDVRGYLLRNRLEQLTVDQSYVAEQVAAGRLTQDEARVHPGQHILLHCIGLEKKLEAVFTSGKTQDNDIYLLCSDGFTHKLWDAELEALLRDQRSTALGDSLQDGLTELVFRARQRGEQDDITAIAIRQDGKPYHKKFPGNTGWRAKFAGKKKPQSEHYQTMRLQQAVHLGAVQAHPLL